MAKHVAVLRMWLQERFVMSFCPLLILFANCAVSITTIYDATFLQDILTFVKILKVAPNSTSITNSQKIRRNICGLNAIASKIMLRKVTRQKD